MRRRKSNPDVLIIKPESVGHWEESTFILDQPVTLPGTGNTFAPPWVINLEDVQLPPGVTRDAIVENMLNQEAVPTGMTVEGHPVMGVAVKPQLPRRSVRVFLANAIGRAGNGFVRTAYWIAEVGFWLHRRAYSLIGATGATAPGRGHVMLGGNVTLEHPAEEDHDD